MSEKSKKTGGNANAANQCDRPGLPGRKVLHRCVDSVLGQTFRDFELILLDDGSPDGSGAICDAYAARDSRVQAIHQKNAGVCAARNTCLDWVLSNSNSQWIFFIDNDDWMHPDAGAPASGGAGTGDEDCRLRLCADGRRKPGGFPEQLTPERWLPKDFYMQRFVNATVCWGKLYHRSCFDGERYPVGKHMEDEFLTYRLLFSQEALTVIPAPLYAYYFNPTGITKSAWTPKRLDAWEAYEQQIAFLSSGASGIWSGSVIGDIWKTRWSTRRMPGRRRTARRFWRRGNGFVRPSRIC